MGKIGDRRDSKIIRSLSENATNRNTETYYYTRTNGNPRKCLLRVQWEKSLRRPTDPS